MLCQLPRVTPVNYWAGTYAAETKVLLAKKLHADKSLEIDDVCQTLRISRSTFYRYLRLE